jgi:hypothetical protein
MNHGAEAWKVLDNFHGKHAYKMSHDTKYLSDKREKGVFSKKICRHVVLIDSLLLSLQ